MRKRGSQDQCNNIYHVIGHTHECSMGGGGGGGFQEQCNNIYQASGHAHERSSTNV